VEENVFYDIVYTIMIAVVCAIQAGLLYVSKMPTVLHGVALVTSNVAVACIASKAPAFFNRHRQTILVVHKLRMAFLASSIISVPSFGCVDARYSV
jgi:hypothetical protein